MTDSVHFTPARDAAGAVWLAPQMETPWGRDDNANYVAAVIPRGFAAYARILHPAYALQHQNEREVHWAEVAAHYQRQAHAQMQWHKISPHRASHSKPRGNSPAFHPPATGHLPRSQAQTLVEILRDCTQTPDDCWFAVWEGWGGLLTQTWLQNSSHLQLPMRLYCLLKGPISSATQTVAPPFTQSASLWWPEDKAWCVATEIDLMWSYVGGAASCIESILADSRLEAWPATLDDRVDVHGDALNP